MFCTYCGNEMPDDAVMCVKCGKLTPEYEASLKGGAVPVPAQPAPAEPLGAAEEKPTVAGTAVEKADGEKHFSWIMSLISILWSMFVFAVFACMHDHYDDYPVFALGAGIFGIIGAAGALIFSVTSCVTAVKEKKKACRTSEYLFPAFLSLLLTVAAIVFAIVMMTFGALYNNGYFFDNYYYM